MSNPNDHLLPHHGTSAAESIALLAVVFTDVVGSTAARQKLGDRVYADAITKHDAIVRMALADCVGGEEIETAGDSFLVAFATASEAVRFALLASARLRRWNEAREVPLRDRFGVHLGEIVVREGARKALFSLALDTCARVTSLGGADRVLLTRAVFDSARQHLPASLEEVGTVTWWNHGHYVLEGIDAPVELCEVAPAGEQRRAPRDGEKAHRVSDDEQRTVPGWRPAPGVPVLGTPYVIERTLGGGAMSEAWLARHRSLRDLRVFKFCFDAERVRSMRREVALFRVLQQRVGAHPHIVRLHDVHLDTPPYYLVTDYSEGRDLLEWWEACEGQVPLDACLEIVAQVAEALQAAHDAGVLHRDVKPANILVEDHADGVHARLLDFGVGQVMSEEVLAGLTQTETSFKTLVQGGSSSHSGTLMYMAPEVIAGKGASPRSDVYSLGVVLWQILAGDPRRPLPPDWERSIQDPLLRDDLSQCLAGEPAERFSGAGQLGRNLRALPQRRAEAERAERATFRRAALRIGLLATLSVVAFGAIAAFAWWNAQEAEQAHGIAQLQARQERTQRIRTAVEAGQEEMDRGDLMAALPWFALGLQLVQGDAAAEWDARVRLESVLGQIPSLAFVAPTVKENEYTTVALAPDGERLVTADYGSGGLTLFDTRTATELAHREDGIQGSVPVWSMDGRSLLVLGDSERIVLDGSTLAPRTERMATAPRRPYSYWLAFERRRPGSDVAERLDAGTTTWFDVHTGIPVPPPIGPRSNRWLANLSANGRTALFRDGRRVLAVDVASGQVLLDLAEPRQNPEMDLDPTGAWLLRWTDDRNTRILEPLRGQASAARTLAHAGLVYSTRWSDDGMRIATASRDRTARVWDVETGRLAAPPLHHLDQVFDVSFGPGGRLATTERAGIVRIWQSKRSDPSPIRWVAGVDAEGERIVAVQSDGSLGCLTRAGLPCGRAFQPPAGTRIFRASVDSSIRWARVVLRATQGAFLGGGELVVDTSTGQVAWDEAGSFEFWPDWGPDGRLAVLTLEGRVITWQAENGPRTLPGLTAVKGLDWRHDGKALAAAGESMAVWDVTRGSVSWALPGPCRAPAWSPDDARLAVGCGTDVHQLDGDTGVPIGPDLRHPVPVERIAWSADGSRLATSTADGYLRLWDARTGMASAPPTRLGDFAKDLAFTTDGRHVVAQPFYQTSYVVVNAVSGLVVTRVPDDAIRQPVPNATGFATLWDLDPKVRAVDEWVDIAEMYSLRRVDADRTDTIDRDALVNLWRRLAGEHPDEFGWDE
ncbi:MAG: protein kinase [Deltaproteobacteria bacterium]|nr:protein kinase [Deltaproteobacteria bacterium]